MPPVAPGRAGLGERRSTAALEFAIVAPVFIGLVVAVFGTGLAGFYQLTLDDAVRHTARQVQIHGPASTGGAAFAAQVCTEFGIIAVNCAANLSYNVQANQPPANFASLAPIAMPSIGKLPNVFPALTGVNNVLIQVAYPLPMTIPIVGKAITFTGTNSILATTIVRTEQSN